MKGHLWKITHKGARAKVRALDYAGALTRAKRIGFYPPDSVCLVTDPERDAEKAREAARALI